MATAPKALDSRDYATVVSALSSYLKSLERARKLHPSGSALFEAISVDVRHVQSLITHFGGIS